MRSLALVPRVLPRPGVPVSPGRARLHIATPEDQRPRPAPEWAWYALRCGALLLALLVGIAVGVGRTTLDVRAERDARLEAQRTAERLSEHSDWIACQLVRTHRVVAGLPTFAALDEIAAEARAQLSPRWLDWCEAP
jgi:hypothetical protein